MPLWLSIIGTILASIDLISECSIRILNIKENNGKWKKITKRREYNKKKRRMVVK